MMGGGEDRSWRMEMEMGIGRGVEGRSAMWNSFRRYCSRSKRWNLRIRTRLLLSCYIRTKLER